MTDDQGYGDMSCNGHPLLKTPNLDRLSNQGVHFTDFHVSPYCSPTRASLMTGRDNRRVGVWHTYGGRDWLFEDETTLAEIFKFNDYATGHFGKWHLGDNYPFASHFRGFDTSFMLGNSGLGGRVPMREFRKDAVQISPDSVKLKIGDMEVYGKVNPGAKSINFQVTLEKGSVDLQALFIDSDGTSRLAYWVYVSRI